MALLEWLEKNSHSGLQAKVPQIKSTKKGAVKSEKKARWAHSLCVGLGSCKCLYCHITYAIGELVGS